MAEVECGWLGFVRSGKMAGQGARWLGFRWVLGIGGSVVRSRLEKVWWQSARDTAAAWSGLGINKFIGKKVKA